MSKSYSYEDDNEKNIIKYMLVQYMYVNNLSDCIYFDYVFCTKDRKSVV